jgi:hypothetical protein
MARAASPETVAIRQLLAERKGDIKAAEAIPLLAQLGHAVKASQFDVIKYHWSNGGKKKNKKNKAAAAASGPKKGKKSKKPVVAVAAPKFALKTPVVTAGRSDLESAIALVEQTGGLTKVREQIAALQKALTTVDTFRQRVAKAS